MPRIEVLLATRDGALFLGDQLASLRAQNMTEWGLVVADDGSRDRSLDILEQATSGMRSVNVLPSSGDGPGQGPGRTFARLLAASRGDWVLPCDQDDVWEPQKLSRLAGLVRDEERREPGPILLVHDLMVCDAALHPCGRFWHRQRFNPAHGKRFGTLLAMNSFPGCAMLANRALLDLALPIPPEAVMHDWWLALVAAAKGRIVVVDEPLVRYRIHQSNAVGALPESLWARACAKRWWDATCARRALALALMQARTLALRHGPTLPEKRRRQLETFCSLPEMPRWKRIPCLLRHGIGKSGIFRNAHFLARA